MTAIRPDSISAMATDNPAKLLFPIGHCIGVFHNSAEPGDHSTQVRVGAAIHQLTDEQFAIWGLAHALPDRPLDEPWSRASVLTAARRAGIGRPDEVLESLLQDGLLAETPPVGDSAVDFARQYRMVPLMLGLGNTPEEPWIYSVGMVGMPIVQLSAMAYDLYEWAHMDPNLWLACEGAAATALRVGIDDALATDPVLTLEALLETLHIMLSHNAICLDSGTET